MNVIIQNTDRLFYMKSVAQTGALRAWNNKQRAPNFCESSFEFLQISSKLDLSFYIFLPKSLLFL